MSVEPIEPSETVRQLFRDTSDFAAYDMLQEIADFTDEDGTLDFNAVLHRVIPKALGWFLMRCPLDELTAMATHLQYERAKLAHPTQGGGGK